MTREIGQSVLVYADGRTSFVRGLAGTSYILRPAPEEEKIEFDLIGCSGHITIYAEKPAKCKECGK